MSKKFAKRTFEGSFLGGEDENLTKTEQEVLHYITKEFLTVQQVAIRRQTSVRAVQKTVQNLKEKGVLNLLNQEVRKKGGGSDEKTNFLRLHNEQIHVNIIWCDERYHKVLGKNNFLKIEGNTVKLYRNSIDIYSNTDFYGETAGECNSKSMNYWTKFISKLQNITRTILLKKGRWNLKRVRGHLSETHNELAIKCNYEHEKIKVVGEDGKVWLIVDNSFNMDELETIHPQKFDKDMDNIVQPFFNDMRENKPPTLSEIMKVINLLVEQNKETATGLNGVVKLLQSQNKDISEKQTITEKPTYIG